MNSALSCWIISDGRRGIENQAMGLAEAVARLRPMNIDRKIISNGQVFKAAQPGLQLALKPKPDDYGFTPPYPQLAIGCGRQAIAPLRALKKKYGPKIFTVYIQNPRLHAKHFDLVIAPEHDALSGNNVISIIGSPNRVTNERIIVETLKFNNEIATLKSPRITMLIGGNSKTHRLDEKSHAAHFQAARSILAQGSSLLITASRRTPQFAKDAYQNLASNNVEVWFADGDGENPFFAMLGAGDAILVTEDSTNMLTEACATGKPVFTLPLSGRAGKFSQLYDRLTERCNVVPFLGNIESPPYLALKETERAARELLDRYETTAQLPKPHYNT
jgi:mitochondrial fission protein ELM1